MYSSGLLKKLRAVSRICENPVGDARPAWPKAGPGEVIFPAKSCSF